VTEKIHKLQNFKNKLCKEAMKRLQNGIMNKMKLLDVDFKLGY